MDKTHIVHVTQSVSRLGGGLFQSVRHLSQAVMDLVGAPLEVVAPEDAHSAEDAKVWAPMPVHTFRVSGPEQFGFTPGLRHHLAQSKPDLVHLHGLWRYTSLAVASWCRRTQTPYVVSAHGMLEPWSLTQSRWLKQAARLLYQDRCLNGAACLRATSQMECESFRQAGYRGPVAVIPNGVEVPETVPPRSTSRHGAKRRALFLSRIHPKKGLIHLVDAWARLRPKDWELFIVGPEERGHLAEVKARVAHHKLEEEIQFPGEVWGTARDQLYADSDLFVLPSFSENFGLVIAEALACRVPAITTQATPWQQLLEHRCGWWIPTGLDPLCEAMQQALTLPPHELAAMGARGRELIVSRYTWPPIAREMVAVYQWVLGGGPKPECVLKA